MTLKQWAVVFTVHTQDNYDAAYKFTGDERRCALRCVRNKWLKPTDKLKRFFETTPSGIMAMKSYQNEHTHI